MGHSTGKWINHAEIKMGRVGYKLFFQFYDLYFKNPTVANHIWLNKMMHVNVQMWSAAVSMAESGKSEFQSDKDYDFTNNGIIEKLEGYNLTETLFSNIDVSEKILEFCIEYYDFYFSGVSSQIRRLNGGADMYNCYLNPVRTKEFEEFLKRYQDEWYKIYEAEMIPGFRKMREEYWTQVKTADQLRFEENEKEAKRRHREEMTSMDKIQRIGAYAWYVFLKPILKLLISIAGVILILAILDAIKI